MIPSTEAQVATRIRVDEGCRLYKYRDSMGIPTIADGFNLERGDAPQIFAALGIDWGVVSAAPIAKTSMPQDAVAPCITQAQADALFEHDLPGYVGAARASLADGIFDSLTPARQFVIVDLVYNLGADGWAGFFGTIAAINLAQQQKNAGNEAEAHTSFVAAAAHLKASDWYGQVGARAMRDVAMMQVGVWCDPTGDGSDIL